MCGIRGLGRCGARTANDTLFALGFVVVLSVVAEIATVAVGLMVGEIYPHLSSSRRYDGIAEGGCRRYYGGHGAAVDVCVYPGWVGGKDYRPHCRCRRRADGGFCGAQCQER